MSALPPMLALHSGKPVARLQPVQAIVPSSMRQQAEPQSSPDEDVSDLLDEPDDEIEENHPGAAEFNLAHFCGDESACAGARGEVDSNDGNSDYEGYDGFDGVDGLEDFQQDDLPPPFDPSHGVNPRDVMADASPDATALSWDAQHVNEGGSRQLSGLEQHWPEGGAEASLMGESEDEGRET